MNREEQQVRDALVIAAYEAGSTMVEAGLPHGLTKGGVRSVLARHNVERRQPASRWTPEQRQAIAERNAAITAAHAQGMARADIAAALGVAYTTVAGVIGSTAAPVRVVSEPQRAPEPEPGPSGPTPARVGAGMPVERGCCARCRGSQRWQRWGATLWAVCSSCGAMSSPRPLRRSRQSA